MRRLQTRPAAHDQAQGALRESPFLALRDLEVHEADGALVLTGSVPSYYYKQLAQETVRPVVGRLGLVNHICVVKTS